MGFTPIPDTVKCALIYRGGGNQEMVNTIYFRKTGGGVTFADLNTVSTAVQAWWTSRLQPLVSQDVTLDRLELLDLTQQGSFERLTSVNLPGTKVGNVADQSDKVTRAIDALLSGI